MSETRFPVPEGINESELDDEMKDDFSLAPVGEGEEKFNSVLKNVQSVD